MARKRTFGSGTLVLGSTGLLCSAIGCVFRIILANLICQNGIAYYQMAYPLYAVLTVVATVGIPAAISWSVSQYIAVEDREGARHFFRAALRRLLFIGALGMAALFALAKPLAMIQGMGEGYRMYYAIAPAMLLTTLIAAFRGWCQGTMMMDTTAASQLIEELGKTVMGLGFVLLWRNQSLMQGAFGALLGIPIAEAAALLFLALGFRKGVRYRKPLYRVATDKRRARLLAKGIGLRSFPIILGGCIQPMLLMVDNLLVVPMLQRMGFSTEMAQARFGLVSGMVNPVAFVASAIGVAIAMALLPTVAASAALRRTDEVERNVAAGLKVTLLVGMPCMAGLMIVGPTLVRVLFQLTDQDSLVAATSLIRTMGTSLLCLMLAQTATAILQGVNHVRRPAVNLCVGVAVKLAVTWALLSAMEGDIAAVGYGSLCGFAVTALLNLRACTRFVYVRLGMVEHLLRPLLATAIMAVAVATVYYGLAVLIPSGIAAFIGVIVGVVSYPFAILRLQAISSEDCRLLPHGIELEYFMHRIGWWV